MWLSAVIFVHCGRAMLRFADGAKVLYFEGDARDSQDGSSH